MLNILNSKIVLASLITLPIVTIVAFASIVRAQTFASGDHFLAANVTTGATWSDPQSGHPGEVIEFRMMAQNIEANTTINNAKVTASLPSAPTTTLVATATVSADNAASVSDTVTVNVLGGEMQGFAYIPGHVRIFSPSCPNGCAGPDTVTTSGVSVGNLAFGESAQVLFKAYITNNPNPTPTPTATPTPTPTATPTPTPTPSVTPTPTPSASVTPTPTPTATPTATPTVSPTPTPTPENLTIQCPNGTTFQRIEGNNIICIQINNINNNNSSATGGSSSACTGSSGNNNNTCSGTGGSVTVTQAAAAPAVLGTTIVKELPKTGLPEMALAAFGLAPAGFGLKRFGKLSQKEDKGTKYIWENRKFHKE